MRNRTPRIVTLAATVAAASAAGAYLDPGSGSMIFQVVVGVLLGAAVAIKAFWRRIAGVFSRRKEREPLS